MMETVLATAEPGQAVDDAVESFLLDRAEAYGRLQKFMRALASEGVSDLAQLTVALRQIRALIG